MDKNSSMRSRNSKSAILVLIGFLSLNLLGWLAAISMPEKSGMIFNLVAWVSGIALVVYVVRLVAAVRVRSQGQPGAPVLPSAFYWICVIVAALANAYVFLWIARPLLALFHVAFFFGDVGWASQSGRVALFVYIAVIAVLFLVADFRPARFLFAILALLVPFVPLWLLFGTSGIKKAAEPNAAAMQRAFVGVFVVAIALVLYSFFSQHSDSTVNSGARSSTTVGLSDEQLAKIPNQIPSAPPTARAGGADAPVGACVSLTGSRTAPTLSIVDCGSADNGYKVVQRVATPDQCVSDVDDKFYLNPPEGQWTACLDYAWSTTDCLSITKGKFASRVNCGDPRLGGREKPVRLIVGSATVDDCPSGGFAHTARRFTICTETQK